MNLRKLMKNVHGASALEQLLAGLTQNVGTQPRQMVPRVGGPMGDEWDEPLRGAGHPDLVFGQICYCVLIAPSKGISSVYAVKVINSNDAEVYVAFAQGGNAWFPRDCVFDSLERAQAFVQPLWK